MWSDEDELNALGEVLVPVLACIQSCHAHGFWRKTYGYDQIKHNDALYIYGEYEAIGDAVMLYSLISLRKIDEFLSDEKKRRLTDIRYSDYGICRKAILLDCEAIIPQNVREKINKCIAHLTNLGHPSVEDWEEFDQVLEMAKPALKRLEKALRRTLKIIDQ